MITKLRDAKEQLSDLVKRAADGEEIIITVRGQPMARLSSAMTACSRSESRGALADELALLAESVRSDTLSSTPQSAWDDLRAERF